MSILSTDPGLELSNITLAVLAFHKNPSEETHDRLLETMYEEKAAIRLDSNDKVYSKLYSYITIPISAQTLTIKVQSKCTGYSYDVFEIRNKVHYRYGQHRTIKNSSYTRLFWFIYRIPDVIIDELKLFIDAEY